MYSPGKNIKGTNNVFYCFTSILYLTHKNKHNVVACPGLGTSVGGMSPREAVDQMENAIKLFDSMMKNEQYLRHIKYYDNNNLVLK